MMKGLIIQFKLPEDVNKKLRIEAIEKGLTLKEVCIKVLSDHVSSK